eukprot:157066_1
MSSKKQLNDQLPSPKHPKTIDIKADDNKHKNIPIRLPYIRSQFHTKINNQISESKTDHPLLISNKKSIILTIDVTCVESSTSSKCSNISPTIISRQPSEPNDNIQTMLQTSTNYHNGVSGSKNNLSNNNQNNDKNGNNSNHDDSGSGSGSGSGGFGGNNGNGNDDGNHENHYHKDTNNDDNDDEDDDEEDEDKEEEKNQSSNLDVNAEEYTPTNRSASMLSTIEEHATMDKQMMFACDGCKFGYSPNGLDRAQGYIKITKMFTEKIIPKMIEENIENVYNFMDKATAIAIYHKAYYDNGKVMVFNYGFHSKLDNHKVLYCVADKNHIDNMRFEYVMRERLFRQDDDVLCNLNKNDLPLSIHELKPMVNVMNYVKVMKNLFNEDIVLKSKWHKQYVFNTKNNKTFNKQRYTFSITKNEFIRIIQSEMKKQNNMILIPILMFNLLSNGYRLEYVNIVHVRDNNSIGISYVCNNRLDDIQVAGIHLNKENLINQHLLAVNCNNCHCFDTFNSNIDELRIGNPDVDKNRCKDLKKKNEDLKQDKQILQYEIKRLENMFAESQKGLQHWKRSYTNIINAITPPGPSMLYSLGTPQ